MTDDVAELEAILDDEEAGHQETLQLWLNAKSEVERLAAENAKLRERAEKAEAERDELLASHQKVVGQHNGLVLAGDSLLAKAGQYRIERDAALAKCRELEEHINRASGVVQ